MATNDSLKRLTDILEKSLIIKNITEDTEIVKLD
jgi:hypothetical protein